MVTGGLVWVGAAVTGILVKVGVVIGVIVGVGVVLGVSVLVGVRVGVLVCVIVAVGVSVLVGVMLAVLVGEGTRVSVGVGRSVGSGGVGSAQAVHRHPANDKAASRRGALRGSLIHPRRVVVMKLFIRLLQEQLAVQIRQQTMLLTLSRQPVSWKHWLLAEYPIMIHVTSQLSIPMGNVKYTTRIAPW
jgi:hypothetical protein